VRTTNQESPVPASPDFDSAVEYGQFAPAKVRKVATRALIILALALTPGALVVFLLYRWHGRRNCRAADVVNNIALEE
jgi:hypothetical protein